MVKEQNKYIGNIYSTLGSLGLLIANTAFNFIPGANIPFMIMSAITGGMLVDDILSSKWERLFKHTGIYNNDKQFPTHIKTEESDRVIKHTFSIPTGVSIIDFYNAQRLLESALCSRVKIENEGNKVIIMQYKVFNYESKWEQVFKNCGLRNKDGQYPELLEVIETKIGNRFIFKLPLGFCLEVFQKYKPFFETAFHKPLKLELTKDYKLVVQIFDVKFKKCYKPKYGVVGGNNMIYPLGISLTINGDEEVKIDLTDEPHILVAGINGSGKTSFIKCLLTAMILRETEIKIIDLKMGGDYNVFKKYKHLTAFIKDVQQAKAEIKNVRRIMEERYKELNKTDCKDFRDYNKRFNNSMKPLVVLIEEYIMMNTKKNGDFINDLNILLAQARACNIKFILSLQRPCHENLDPRIKANCNHVVGFGVNNTYNSAIVLGQSDNRLFTDIKSKGECILLNDHQDIHFKSYFLEDREIAKMIKPFTDESKKVDEVVEDNRVIQLVPKVKQIAAIEKNKVVDLL